MAVAAELSEMLSVRQNWEIRQKGNGIYGLTVPKDKNPRTKKKIIRSNFTKFGCYHLASSLVLNPYRKLEYCKFKCSEFEARIRVWHTKGLLRNDVTHFEIFLPCFCTWRHSRATPITRTRCSWTCWSHSPSDSVEQDQKGKKRIFLKISNNFNLSWFEIGSIMLHKNMCLTFELWY